MIANGNRHTDARKKQKAPVNATGKYMMTKAA
jgi:hypothetical protein